jgi:hypothetical protein
MRCRRLHAPNCVQPDIDWLLAEVRRLRAGIADHRALMRTRGVDGRGTPAQEPNERLWALLDQED